MSSVQHRVSDYLQCELYHVLGAYRVTEERLRHLEKRLVRAEDQKPDDAPPDELLRLTRIIQRYNGDLARERHCARGDRRHPVPKELPLSRPDRFSTDAEDVKRRDPPWRGPEAYAWVIEFYENAVHVLNPKRHPEDMSKRERDFSACLTCPRDGVRSPATDEPTRRRLRHDRFTQRLEMARRRLPESGERASDQQNSRAATFLERITTANLGDAAGSLPMFVLIAQAEAHLSMHGVEALLSLPLGDHARVSARKTDILNAELHRCIALATFAYSVSRSAPWIFAEDAAESEWVFSHLTDAWQNVVPTRCMWIGAQASLLALHRRAYARSLMQRGEVDNAAAYNDYHKLQRLIRDTERRVKAAPIHVEGALEFLAALDAQAHHHIGELYRSEHAQTSALRHFDAGEDRLKPHHSGDMNEVLTNSRWLVQLHVSRGKSSYELGHHKDSLRSYLMAWRAFLQLLAADTQTEASTTDIDDAIVWLTEVRHEPELRKNEVYNHVRRVVEQLSGITVDYHVGALAAEILLRLGHLLFVLNVGQDLTVQGIKTIIDARTESRTSNREALWPYQLQDAAVSYVIGRLRNGLAALCLQKAAECDRHSTLVGADLAKIRFRLNELGGPGLPEAVEERLTLPELAPVSKQWPLGGDDYERIARVVEYLLLRALVERRSQHQSNGGHEVDEQKQNAIIAVRLLLAFFTHTDSINVRKSQAHRFLTQIENRETQDPYTHPTIEFVCMRRYSSAFPLLPRPSAFHAHGGGYFVRLHRKPASDDNEAMDDRLKRNPFGIVIDPGTDFVENLYRTGYSLSDIDLIIVTHDHVDHVGALDALLSLLYERSQIISKEYGKTTSPVKVLANASVRSRYEYASRIGGKEFLSLEDFATSAMPDDVLPSGFELVSICSSLEPNGSRGHSDLGENPSFGVCFRTTDGASIAFTSDIPAPTDDSADVRQAWEQHWHDALTADVLVAHLSTVPLTELRKLADLSAVEEQPRPGEVNELAGRAHELSANAGHFAGNVACTSPALADTIKALRAQLDAFETQLRSLPHRAVVVGAAEEIERTADAVLRALADARGLDPTDVSGIDGLARGARTLGKDAQHLQLDSEELLEARRSLEAADTRLQGRIEFALWLRSRENGPLASLLEPVPAEWRPPAGHPYLRGFLDWARAYRHGRHGHRTGLFVVGELSEELGTARGKVAAWLNHSLFLSRNGDGSPRDGPTPKLHALTADIGLRVLVTVAERESDCVQVLCSTCNLDMDRVRTEQFQCPSDIREVCVKGENEGIFYNCDQHDPSQQTYPTFLEQLERFDIFGR